MFQIALQCLQGKQRVSITEMHSKHIGTATLLCHVLGGALHIAQLQLLNCSVPGKLRLAPHAPSPWLAHVFTISTTNIIIMIVVISVITIIVSIDIIMIF